jgi:glycosyltransferase involved in cell wall biosynthesis
MTQQSPLLTIVTPCHNALPYLRGLLDSVSRQTFSAWEHLVVDDGSTDASAAEVESRLAGEPRLRLIRQCQSGVARARAAGYAAASAVSRYVYFLDADDLLEPDMLATLVSYLQAHPAVGVAYCDYRCIDGDGREAAKHGEQRYMPGLFGVRTVPAHEPRTPLFAVYSWAPVMESLSMIRRSVFDAAGGWDPAIGQPGEGVDLFTRVALFSEVHFVNQVLYVYRRHQAQASHDWSRIARQDLKVQMKWRDRRDLSPRERTIIDAAQAFRAGRLRIHHNWAAARRYFRRGQFRHGLHCCFDVCRTAGRRALRQSPWPTGT